MSTLASARSRLQIEADRRAAEQARRVGSELRQLREDCGLGQGVVARAAGISAAHLCRIEAGQTDASRRALARIAAVLGPDVFGTNPPEHGTANPRPATGSDPRIAADHLHPRWSRHLEVRLTGRVRGFVDLVLVDAPNLVVAGEVESGIRRLEQQLRWGHEKAGAVGEQATRLRGR
jgi:transcriptional regulator with XRE-family HTH domain